MTFEFKRHSEIKENFQGIYLTEFSIAADIETNNDQIVEAFIRSTSFSVDSLPDFFKTNSEKIPSHRGAFNIDRIGISDFKKKSKKEVTTFLCDFINKPDWGEDRNEFAKLLDRYFEIHNLLGSNDFYIISKEWFENSDKRLIDREESWFYSYYFLLLSIDRRSKLLTLFEWIYD